MAIFQVLINFSENLLINRCRKETQIQFDHSKSLLFYEIKFNKDVHVLNKLVYEA